MYRCVLSSYIVSARPDNIRQLPLVALTSWLIFGDVLSPMTGVGCAIIVASAVTITLSKEGKAPDGPISDAAPQYMELQQDAESLHNAEPGILQTIQSKP